MTLKEAIKRIEALEKELALLKVRPAFEQHYHYYYQQPAYQPLYQPMSPISVPTVWGVGGTAGGQMTTTTSTFKPGDDVAWTYTGQGN